VDHERAAVHGSMVDHGWRRLKGSPEHGLVAALVSGSSLAVGENKEETSGVPTVGEDGRCSAGGRPVMVRRWWRRFALDDKRLDAVESGRGGGTFYRAEEATEGRGDGAVRGTASGASSMCWLREWRRGAAI
jgi:hypothetical protein